IAQARVDDGTLTGIAPPGAAGAVDVHVVGLNGVAYAADAYHYRTAPVVTRVAPISGPAEGGVRVVIEGEGLAADSVVYFGDRESGVLASRADGRRLEVAAPAGQPGAVVDVTVANDWGAAVATGAFTWR